MSRKTKRTTRLFADHSDDEIVEKMIEAMKQIRETIKDYPEFKEAYFGENYYVKEKSLSEEKC